MSPRCGDCIRNPMSLIGRGLRMCFLAFPSREKSSLPPIDFRPAGQDVEEQLELLELTLQEVHRRSFGPDPRPKGLHAQRVLGATDPPGFIPV